MGVMSTGYRRCLCCWWLAEEPIVWRRGRNGASVGVWYVYAALVGVEVSLVSRIVGSAGNVRRYPLWLMGMGTCMVLGWRCLEVDSRRGPHSAKAARGED